MSRYRGRGLGIVGDNRFSIQFYETSSPLTLGCLFVSSIMNVWSRIISTIRCDERQTPMTDRECIPILVSYKLG